LIGKAGGRKEESMNERPLLEINIIGGKPGPIVELNPSRVTQSPLAQQILFCVRKERRSPGQIADAVNADIDAVTQHLRQMTQADVLQETEGHYRANCILFDPQDVAFITDQMSTRAEQVAQIVGDHLAGLDRAIERLSAQARGQQTDTLRWIILGVLVLNNGLKRALHRQGVLTYAHPKRPDGGAWFYLPHVIESHLPFELGVNLHFRTAHSQETRVAQYWNTDLISSSQLVASWQIVEGIMPALTHLFDGPRPVDELRQFPAETVSTMVDHGFAERRGQTVSASIPVFTQADSDTLVPVIDTIVAQILSAVYADFPDDVYALLDSLGFSFVRSDYIVHAFELAAVGSMRALSRKGILESPPLPVPTSWGAFGWKNEFPAFSTR
jgi:hypothetical protein